LSIDAERRCRIHFTVADSHKTLFERNGSVNNRIWNEGFEHAFRLTSHCSHTADTIAIDSDGHPSRWSGQIAFRLAGMVPC
jgi:hypothetical protein